MATEIYTVFAGLMIQTFWTRNWKDYYSQEFRFKDWHCLTIPQNHDLNP